MAGSSHKHTRLVNYRQRRPSRPPAFRLWFIIPISAVLAFIIALILGNTLGDMVSDIPEVADTPPSSSATLPESPHGPLKINAPHVTLKGIYDNTAANVKAQIPSGTNAVSMTLFDADGTPYYSSPVAASFGNPCGELTLKNVFKPTEELGVYSSVLFPSSLTADTDPAKSAVIGAYDATLAAELYEAGADEIVIYFSEPGSDTPVINGEFYDLMKGYISAIRNQAEGLRIAIVLSPRDLKNADNAVTVERLAALADLCALDLTFIDDADKLTSTLLELSVSILRHEMRLIMKNSGKTEEFITTAHEIRSRLGMDNIQYVE